MSNRKLEIFEDQLKAIAENFLNGIQEFSVTPPSVAIEEPQPVQEPVAAAVAIPEPTQQIAVTDPNVAEPVPVEPPPRFRVFWNAWKDGNTSKGESESTLETAQMARAETMTKLYDLGFSKIVILAIETIEPPKEEIAPQSI